MKNFISTLLFLLFVFLLNGQDYKTTIKLAEKQYEQENYEAAVESYALAFSLPHKEDYYRNRLNAAVANAFLNKEMATKENLEMLLRVTGKRGMKDIRNYKIFQQYHSKEWWEELEQKMKNRLAELIAHHKNLSIFKHGRNIIYSAIRINKQGDTLANTFITMIPDGTGWGDEAAQSQSQVIFRYDYSEQDSLDHISELRDIVQERFWLKADTTGVIENEESVWMHPFRNNEFFKTEIAPFPNVIFPIGSESIQKEKSTIAIMRNWGTYSPSMTKNYYFYDGMEEKEYAFAKKMDCHKFLAYGHNSKYGISHIEYFFNKEYGFTEMNYQTYDDDKIHFKIVKIEE